MAKYNRKITNELKNSILQNFTDFQKKYNEKSDGCSESCEIFDLD